MVWPPVHLRLPGPDLLVLMVSFQENCVWASSCRLQVAPPGNEDGHTGAPGAVHTFTTVQLLCTFVHVCVGKPSALVVRQLKTNKGQNANNVNSLLLDLTVIFSVRVCVRACACVCEIWLYANKKPHGYVGHVNLFSVRPTPPLL